MEGLMVGILTGLTAVLGVALWQLMVRPESMLALWPDRRGGGRPWFDYHPGALRALRFTVGALLLGVAFLTGLTLTVVFRLP
ncbi:MAG: hypothetical protein KTR31_38375 [Myxococcales bacterium]|nr:hypothetical protein [Myxococcales bacterium]